MAKPRGQSEPSTTAPTALPADWGPDTTVETKLAWLHATYKDPPPEHVGQLPKPTRKDNQRGKCEECGGFHGLPAVHLDYLGHAELTDILCFVDPLWNWEPFSVDERGLPAIMSNDRGSVMWIRLTIWGVTRPGVGTAIPSGPDTMKELIGDALRNAGMRFGIGTSLWSKIDGVDRKIEAGQHIEPDADHDPNAQPAPQDRPQSNGRTTARQAAAKVPDVWTYDGLVELGIRVLNPMCRERELPCTGKVEDYAERLIEWQRTNAAPTQPATDVPDDRRDEDEPAADLPTKPPPESQHPDDGTDPALSDDDPEPEPDPDDLDATEEALADGDTDQDISDSEIGNDDDDWGSMPADPESVKAIMDDVRKLTGAKARAYAGYRREKKLPAMTKPELWTNDTLDGVVKFLDALDQSVPA